MRSLVFEGNTGGACERLREQDNLPVRAEWQLRDIAAGENSDDCY
jgi:hypothetical protein